MKNLIFGIALVFVSSFSFAKAPKDLIKEENKVLKCVMKILPSQKINHELLINLTEILKKLGRVQVDQLQAACKEQEIISKNLPRKSHNEIKAIVKDYVNSAGSPTSPDWTYYQIISDAVSITSALWCNLFGVHADVGLGVALGFGASAGKCVSQTFKRYVVVAPQVDYGLGVGVFATLQPFEGPIIWETNNRLWYNGLINNEEQVLIGLGVAIGIPNGDLDLLQVGLGVGFLKGQQIRLILKLIPIGYDFNELRQVLGLDP